jgi:hypothetical protein
MMKTKSQEWKVAGTFNFQRPPGVTGGWLTMLGAGSAGGSDVGGGVPGSGGSAGEGMFSVPIKLSNNNTVIVGLGGLPSAKSGSDSQFGPYRVCGSPTQQIAGAPNYPNRDTVGGGPWWGGNFDHPTQYSWEQAFGYCVGYKDSAMYYAGSSCGPWAVNVETTDGWPGGGSGGYLIGGDGDIADPDPTYLPGTGGGTQIFGGGGRTATTLDASTDGFPATAAGSGGGGGGTFSGVAPGTGGIGYDGYVAIMWIEP